MKKCFKCGEAKDLSFFYKHSKMKDGYLNKCKECTKIDVSSNRDDKKEYYRDYDRKRGNRQEVSYMREYREKHPKRWACHKAVHYALRSGVMKKQLCEVCGSSSVHAHHPDYSKPFDVMWLCAAHHQEWHSRFGEGING